MQDRLPLNFILSLNHDMIPDHGEDSFCYSFCDNAGLVGVFDGCGGAGARKHKCYCDNTEAYMASRLCAGAFYDAFRVAFPCDYPAQYLVDSLFIPAVEERLTYCTPPKDPSHTTVLGSMVRTLPSTAAAALLQQQEDGTVSVTAFWAGDSRVYAWDACGLTQLTTDHTTVPDPMDTLYEDGVLKNLISCGKTPKISSNTVQLKPPFMVFGATDGCFGYLSTPMEFEGLLLSTLLQTATPNEWEQALDQAFGGISGDDYTLCLAAVGYQNLDHLKQQAEKRLAYLRQYYLNQVATLPVDDRQSRTALWNNYKNDYLKYIKDASF